ncbi:hypothetical protein HYT53_03690 [Candidatus Woesearchaeota archaeon]|nr:hypothetical protein [Candidatus Woesearchaeota archaeon]
MGEAAKNLEQMVGLDELTTKVKDFQDSPSFRLLQNSLHKVATDYYDAVDGKAETKELVLDETRARDLANKLWDTAAEQIVVNYLAKGKPSKIKELMSLKDEKDPATGKPQWESFIREHLGMNRDELYEALKTRSVVKRGEIDAVIVKPIYDAHANAFTSKAVATKIDSIEKANAALDYLKQLKNANPKTYEAFNIPTTVNSVEQAQRLYVSATQLLSKDYKPKVAETYKK